MLPSLMMCVASVAALGQQDEKELRTEWEAFKAKHGRNYLEGPEDEFRFKIFAENKRYIEEHNEKFHRGQKSYRLTMNHFGDMHHNERMESHKCGVYTEVDGRAAEFLVPANLNIKKLPRSVDWRKKGYVTPVKQQGGCTSCWAFSATGSLEGQHFRKTGELVSLSEQNLVDCVHENYNACYLGNAWTAFRYIWDNAGVDTEESYPYVGRKQPCKFKRANVGANVTGYVMLKRRSEKDLKAAVATVGPVSVFINSNFTPIWLYKDGIIDDPECTSDDLDHFVLVVGYGVKHGKKYWLIKNSWGPNWGKKGYAMIARDKNNMCGIASYASYPLV
ncbi:cathepsin L-like peptidase [Amblyomma americanum]